MPCARDAERKKDDALRIAEIDALVEKMHTTLDWHELQRGVAAAFNRTPGWRARIDHPVAGARIGSVNVDVLAKFQNPSLTATGFKDTMKLRGSFAFQVIVECKNWRRRVPQEKVFALKQIVEDTGASLGILVTRAGIQRGAAMYLRKSINVIAATTTELEMILSGQAYGVCAECGSLTFFPVVPTLGSSWYCKDCFRKRRKNKF